MIFVIKKHKGKRHKWVARAFWPPVEEGREWEEAMWVCQLCGEIKYKKFNYKKHD